MDVWNHLPLTFLVTSSFWKEYILREKMFESAVKFIFSHHFDFHFDKQNHTKHLPNWFDLLYGILNLQL